MTRRFLPALVCGSVFLFGMAAGFGDEYERFEIKQGSHKSVVDERYGPPLLVERLKPGFLPITRQKALYKAGESTYMILRFFSGRVSEITILDDAAYEDAVSMFESSDKKR